MINNLTWEEFSKVKMAVGTIMKVQDFPEARKPAYQLWINFGEEIGERKTSAQITDKYSKEALIGKQVVAVINFPEKQIANFMSQCLLLGAVGEGNEVTIISPESKIENGLFIS
ncbi:tRNA-binding protein [Neptunitalea lumnitzerae]|uniref:tRNA-binding protein n=1 Tax=Neptunitalea lumnitzerae TaxID=2965509 RepID=A0ABQ5MKP4_9FLAO|nr:tRNA-binding protein [Neptunitalea sp. Y10]GLB49912.1 tRNA-binding protein [Neptunitalea sp. Y10]